jgi:hypothetical protein
MHIKMAVVTQPFATGVYRLVYEPAGAELWRT